MIPSQKKLLFIFCCVFFFRPWIFVRAEYLLPYPSYMPGNKLYRISRAIDQLKKYWYFGNVAQIKYHLGLADKYLVEAKTLLEYKQYLLAVDALKRSDVEFQQLPDFVVKVEKENKDMKNLIPLISEAAKTHINELIKLESVVPEQYIWTPEKMKPTDLNLKSIVTASKDIRNRVVREVSSLR